MMVVLCVTLAAYDSINLGIKVFSIDDQNEKDLALVNLLSMMGLRIAVLDGAVVVCLTGSLYILKSSIKTMQLEDTDILT